MADEELRDLELTHGYGGGSGGRWAGGAGGAGGTTWGRSPGAGGSLSASHQRMAPSQHHSNRAAEAEDIMGRAQVPRGRSGLYYSPPGTSYTIVERPPGVGGGGGGGGGGGVAGGGGGGGGGGSKPRGTYLGSSTSFSHNNRTPASGKKRPISPEQILDDTPISLHMLQRLGHIYIKAQGTMEPHQTHHPMPPPPTMDQLVE